MDELGDWQPGEDTLTAESVCYFLFPSSGNAGYQLWMRMGNEEGGRLLALSPAAKLCERSDRITLEDSLELDIGRVNLFYEAL